MPSVVSDEPDVMLYFVRAEQTESGGVSLDLLDLVIIRAARLG
jgi:hypothetical protein